MKVFMKVLRKVKTICPFCMKKIDGSLLQKTDCVVLYRDCHEHGPTEIVLSNNPIFYAELDRFYFEVLKKGSSKGRITNYWVVATSQCQMQCDYCQVNVAEHFFENMNRMDFDKIIQLCKGAKLTLSGGEPTLHQDIFYFFRNAARLKRCAQLATNGVRLSDENFCRLLKEANLKEVRISYEMLDTEHEELADFKKWMGKKSVALKYLEKGHFNVSLSPTIFKGINESLLLETLEYAKTRPFVKEISVNGFSWVGGGANRDRAEMIMPDEMVDVICRGFNVQDRESIFTLQKALFIFLQLVNIKLCMYTQIMIFVRRNGKLELFVDYFNMKRMKRALKWWERFSNAPRHVQFITFGLAMAFSMKPKAILLSRAILNMIAANIFAIDFSKYPHDLLPVVLNTNCSVLTADEEVSKQCMSGVIVKINNKLIRSSSTVLLIGREMEKFNLEKFTSDLEVLTS